MRVRHERKTLVKTLFKKFLIIFYNQVAEWQSNVEL